MSNNADDDDDSSSSSSSMMDIEFSSSQGGGMLVLVLVLMESGRDARDSVHGSEMNKEGSCCIKFESMISELLLLLLSAMLSVGSESIGQSRMWYGLPVRSLSRFGEGGHGCIVSGLGRGRCLAILCVHRKYFFFGISLYYHRGTKKKKTNEMRVVWKEKSFVLVLLTSSSQKIEPVQSDVKIIFTPFIVLFIFWNDVFFRVHEPGISGINRDSITLQSLEWCISFTNRE
jgi:hypothetical protein